MNAVRIAKLSALLLAASLAAGCGKSASSPVGCWIDESGAQTLEIVKLEGNALRIQSLQGTLDGAFSGDTLSATTGEPLHETIRMVFDGDKAVYEFLGTRQSFHRTEAPAAGCLSDDGRDAR